MSGVELRAAGIVCKPVTRFGGSAGEILSLAQKGDYELIVMGRRGRGAAAKLLLGLVSDKVVRAATCPGVRGFPRLAVRHG